MPSHRCVCRSSSSSSLLANYPSSLSRLSPSGCRESDELALRQLLAQMVALALLLLAPALTLPSVAHRPQLARHSQLQLLASASPKEEITPTAGLSVGAPHRSHCPHCRQVTHPLSAQPQSDRTLRLPVWQVGVACIGCVLFGYHLGVVNAPLDAISATLGFAGDAVRQGQVVSIGLAGAFLGSLGGAAQRTHDACAQASRRTQHTARPPHTSLTRTPHAPCLRRAARRRRRPQGQLRVHGDDLRRRRSPLRQRALLFRAAAWPPDLRPGHRRRAVLRVPLHPRGGAAITARLPLLAQPGAPSPSVQAV